MSAPTKSFRFVSSDRRVREDRRFVVGKGRFAADIAMAGVRHVALVTCPHPAARIVAIDKSRGAELFPACITCSTAASSPRRPSPLLAGLDTPNVPRRPLAVDVARYSGEWVAAVVADTRALAEDAAELVQVDYEPLPFVLDGEEAYAPGSPLVHEAHGSNVLLDRTFVWGEVEKDFAESPHRLSLKVKWGRSSTVPIETFGVLASWDPWREVLDVQASIQMPRFPDQVALALKLPGSAVRVHNDVDVGGSYGVKRGIKHAVLVGFLSRRLGFPVRLLEDRLENMRGGDAHGPERNFDLELAFDDAGVIRSMKMRALDNVGAYAGRSPFQLGKPISAIVGPYRIKSVQYQAIAVTSNKTTQEAVRAFGQSPTNFAIERAIEEVAAHRGLDRLEVRRRNLIRAEQFPYLIPSGTTYDSGDYHAVIDKVLARADYPRAHRRARPAAQRGAARRHRHNCSRPIVRRRTPVMESRPTVARSRPRSAMPAAWIRERRTSATAMASPRTTRAVYSAGPKSSRSSKPHVHTAAPTATIAAVIIARPFRLQRAGRVPPKTLPRTRRMMPTARSRPLITVGKDPKSKSSQIGGAFRIATAPITSNTQPSARSEAFRIALASSQECTPCRVIRRHRHGVYVRRPLRSAQHGSGAPAQRCGNDGTPSSLAGCNAPGLPHDGET